MIMFHVLQGCFHFHFHESVALDVHDFFDFLGGEFGEGVDHTREILPLAVF